MASQEAGKSGIVETVSHDKSMELFLSRSNDEHSGVRRICTEDVSSIATIATKVGITPNQLVEMYETPDGGVRCDLHAMAKDYDHGKGVQAIRDKHKSLEEENGPAHKPAFLDNILNGQTQSGHEGMQR